MRYIVNVDGKDIPLEVAEDGTVSLGGRGHQVSLQSIDGAHLFSLLIDNRSYELYVEEKEGEFQVLLRGEMHVARVGSLLAKKTPAVAPREAPTGEAVIKAPMPGLVVSVLVENGQGVRANQGLVILEAMKMDNELRSPREGTVHGLRVAAGDKVEQGEILAMVK